MKTVVSIFSAVLIMFAVAVSAFALDSSETIAYKKKMTTAGMGPGKIHYWIDSGCTYTVSIPNAASGLANPPGGLTNPLALSYTSVQSYAKMEFYEIYGTQGIWEKAFAATMVFRKNGSGIYEVMTAVEREFSDWVYATIFLNEALMGDAHWNSTLKKLPTNITGGSVNAFRKKVIMHEMAHAFGCKDLYNNSNKDSLMFANGIASTGINVTSDVNKVFNDKYK